MRDGGVGDEPVAVIGEVARDGVVVSAMPSWLRRQGGAGSGDLPLEGATRFL
jgi:hypothetical protein